MNRAGKAWPTTIGSPAARQIGAAVAVDERNGAVRPIWGMGRHNHENSVAIPGYGHPVVLSGDDSFVTTPAQSQLYSYIADDSRAVWNDEGDLWAFVADGVDNYFDFPFGSSMSVTGKFVKVPKQIATGRKPDGTDLMAADVGVSAAAGHRLADRRQDGRADRRAAVDARALGRHAGAAGVRVRSRRGHRLRQTAGDAERRLRRRQRPGHGGAAPPGLPSPQPNRSTNGRVWKLVLDKNDPTKVTSFSILIEGDDAPVKAPNEIHQPDNIESTLGSLLITEDPGSSQQFPPGSDVPGAPNFDRGRRRHGSGSTTSRPATKRVVAKVNQSADESPVDEDANPSRGNLGAWESSGIIDASSIFGPGAFLVDVQAGTFVIDEEVRQEGPDTLTYQRDGGQLGLLRITDTGPIAPVFGG